MNGSLNLDCLKKHSDLSCQNQIYQCFFFKFMLRHFLLFLSFWLINLILNRLLFKWLVVFFIQLIIFLLLCQIYQHGSSFSFYGINACSNEKTTDFAFIFKSLVESLEKLREKWKWILMYWLWISVCWKCTFNYVLGSYASHIN